MGMLLLNSSTDLNPRELFSNNEQGLWLDPSDMTAGKAGWRRNLLTYSEQFDNAAWTKQGLGTGGIAPTVTANSATAPDGTTTADTITFGIKAGAATNRIIQTTTVSTASRQFTGSVWLKVASGTVSISIYVDDSVTGGPYGGANTKTVTVTTSWQRFDLSVQFTPTETGFVRLSLVQDSAATTSAFDLYAWGAQLELGSSPSEYQPITDFSTEFKAAFPTHTLYQDSNGVTPCTAAGDPVGLILDQSRGGLGALGSELWNHASAQNGGTESQVIGTQIYRIYSSAGSLSIISVNGVLTSGKWYRVQFTVDSITTLGGGVRVGDSGAIVTTTGTHVTFINTVSPDAFFKRVSGATDIQISNISVREVPGNHAYQTTSASRPTLARIPVSGRRNLLTRTEEFDNAAWVKFQSTISANATTAPDGTSTADSLVDTAVIQEHNCYQSQTTTTATFSVYAKANARSTVGLRAYSNANEFYTAIFDLQNGVVSLDNETGTTFSTTTSSITSVGSGWYRCSISYTRSSGTTFHVIDLCNSTNPTLGTGGSQVYLGNGTGIFIWGAQLETGSSPSNYQKVVATTDVTESGVGDLWHLVFDGSDDSLVTNSISFDTWTQETRRNLLVDTESLSTGNWVSNGGTVTENTTVAPDGTTTADTLTRSTAPTEGRYQSVAFTGDGAKAVSVYVKAGTAPSLGVWLFDSTATVNRILATVDMTGATPIVTLTAGASSAVENVGNGWFRLTFVSTSVTAANTNRLYLMPAYGIASANGQTSIFWGVQAENATASTTYQRVGTDEMTVIAGVRKLQNSTTGMIAELSVTSSANNGAFWVLDGNKSGGGADKLSWRSRGTAGSTCDGNVAVNTSVVFTGLGDISGDVSVQRINAIETESNVTDQGTGNFGNHVLYIGRRASSSLPFNGHLYQLIIRGKTTPTGKLLEAERFVGRKTGVTGI